MCGPLAHWLLKYAAIDRSRNEFTITRPTEQRSVGYHDTSAQNRHYGPTGDLPTFPGAVVGHMEVCHGQTSALTDVHEHDVGVTPDRDDPFAWVESENLRRVRRRHRGKLGQAHASLAHALGVDDPHPYF